jgi:uncharacterized protein YbbC (DUF1343 family)
MEGPLVEEKLLSFISIASIPLRHGMTLGELACYFKNQFFQQTKLVIVPMYNYDRFNYHFTLQAPLSPNLANVQSVYGYSFLGLLGEVAPFDVGVGTENAFTRLGLPKDLIDQVAWNNIKNVCKKHGIHALSIAYQHPSKKRDFEGLQCNIKNVSTVTTIPLIFDILKIIHDAGIKLVFSSMFDKAIGSSLFQNLYAQGQPSIFFNEVQQQIRMFYKRAQNCFLYKPWPKIVDY